MNRRHIILFASFLFFLPIQAQLFKGGLSIGLLASQVDGDNMNGYHKPGLYAGAFTYVPLREDNLQLQTGIYYMQKGCKATNTRTSGELNTYHMTLHQIGMPIMIRFNCQKPYRFEAGCSMDIMPMIHIRMDGNLYEIRPENYEDYNFFELSGFCGVQWQRDKHWGAHLQFMYSITPVGKSHYISSGLRNNSLLLAISYIF